MILAPLKLQLIDIAFFGSCLAGSNDYELFLVIPRKNVQVIFKNKKLIFFADNNRFTDKKSILIGIDTL